MTPTRSTPERRKRHVVAMTAVAALVMVAPVAAAAKGDGPRRTLEAVGRATIRTAPDTVRVVVAVETRATTAAAAATGNARITQRVADALRRGIEGDDDGEVSTSGYSLRAQYEYRKAEQRQELVGYIATNSVTVTSSELDRAGALIDAAVGAGANTVSTIDFSLRNDESARRQAVLEAGRQARARIDAIAESLDVEVGQLLRATTESAAPGPPRPYLARGAMMMAESADAGTPIAAGDIAVEMAVHVVFGVR